MDRKALKLVDLSQVGRAAGNTGAVAGSGFPHGLGRAGVHEVCAAAYGDGPAAAGFALAAGAQANTSGAVAWVHMERDARGDGQLSARGLAALGARPGRMLHIMARKPMEALWAVEEAITSSSVACVVAQCSDLDFTASRRLTLASAARGTPVILLLPHTRSGASAADGRWRVSVQPSAPNRLHARGLGHPRWEAVLERSRTAPEAIGRRYALEFDDETFSLHMAGGLAPRQAAPRAPTAATAGAGETGLRKAG
ncbi:MAG: hypothetical protein AAFY10_12070 [Pseudomonadota bacterium]